jgi:hypothetical protein
MNIENEIEEYANKELDRVKMLTDEEKAYIVHLINKEWNGNTNKSFNPDEEFYFGEVISAARVLEIMRSIKSKLD